MTTFLLLILLGLLFWIAPVIIYTLMWILFVIFLFTLDKEHGDED